MDAVAVVLLVYVTGHDMMFACAAELQQSHEDPTYAV